MVPLLILLKKPHVLANWATVPGAEERGLYLNGKPFNFENSVGN